MSWLECGPNMYGGYNNSDCQSCPENSGNSRGYNHIAESCGCLAGYTGQNGSPCIGKSSVKIFPIVIHFCYYLVYTYVACSKGTFKPINGSGICQDCPLTLSSEAGSAGCSCASGHEPSETQCTGQKI